MKRLIFICLLTFSTIFTLHAEEKDLTPAAMAEIALSENLIALGKARGEPMMILAAVRIRATLGGKSAALGDGFTSQEDAIAMAKKFAKGDDALIGVIDDVAAGSSRRMCIYARNGVCF